MANMMVHTNSGYELTNIKVYELSALDNLVDLQAIIDFVVAGNYAMVMYNNNSYFFRYKTDLGGGIDGYIFFETNPSSGTNTDGSNRIFAPYIQIRVNQNGDNVIDATRYLASVGQFLGTSNATSSIFTPTADNHPANKKYVDDVASPLSQAIGNLQDQFAHFVQGGTTLPLSSVTNLTEGQAILDFVYVQNGVVYVLYNNKYYTMNKSSFTTLTFSNMDFDANGFYVNTLTFTFNASHEIQSIAAGHKNIMTVENLPVDIDDDTLYLVQGS